MARDGSEYRRFGSFNVQEAGKDALVIYDRTEPDAWIQSTAAVTLDRTPESAAEDA